MQEKSLKGRGKNKKKNGVKDEISGERTWIIAKKRTKKSSASGGKKRRSIKKERKILSKDHDALRTSQERKKNEGGEKPLNLEGGGSEWPATKK